ncbi:unnamed protein product, partial [Meganyctiphanes norvegica]
DVTAALNWVFGHKSHPIKYIENCITEINSTLDEFTYKILQHNVSMTLKPEDMLTKATYEPVLWKHEPEFLLNDIPQKEFKVTCPTFDTEVIVAAVTTWHADEQWYPVWLPDVKRTNYYQNIKIACCWVFRFTYNLLAKVKKDRQPVSGRYITPTEIVSTETRIIKEMQKKWYKN